MHYIAGGEGLCAIYEIKNGVEKMYYVLTDHLGSYDKIYDDEVIMKEEYSFDAWGRRRNPTNWSYSGTWTYNFTSRGFTGHEHLDGFDVINMNGRCYDPNIGRFLSPDNYVQMPDFTQNFNRYAYCLNNPLNYTDPSGEFIFTTLALIIPGAQVFLPWAIGADIGMWSGGSIANGTANPFKWDYSSGKTWGYMAGGAFVGGLSGGAANAVATSGIPFANTAAIMTGSTINSVGMNMVTGGQTDITIGFGVASYNVSQNEWGYLGKKGNSALKNIGYGIGAFANLSDAYGFVKGAYGSKAGEIDLATKNDPIGHSALVDANGNNVVSVGPDWSTAIPGDSFWDAPGTNDWYNHLNDQGLDKLTVTRIRITNVRLDKINDYVSNNLQNFRYQALHTSCVTEASRALLKAGVLNLPVLRHPSLLQLQMFARQNAYYTSYIYR